LYLLLSGRSPFPGSNDLQILKQIKDGQYAFEPCEVWDNVSSSAKDLIKQMLSMDPAERIRAAAAAENSWVEQDAASTTGSGISPSTVANLRSFQALQRLKRASVEIFERHLSEDKERSLTSAFVELDPERHGLLQVEDVEFLVMHSHCSHATQIHLRQVLYRTAGKSGKVDYDKILSAMKSAKAQLQVEVLESAFCVLDVDSKGSITSEELSAMLGREVPLMPGVGMPLQDVLGMKVADTDRILNGLKLSGDAQADCREFIRVWNEA